MSAPVLAIDQGTTSTRAIVFDASQRIIGVGQEEFAQHFPRSGWVEHDLEEIWRTTLSTVRAALAAAKVEASEIAAIGITNQRETVCVWERESGRPVHRAIVWQDRRTADLCKKLVSDGLEPMITGKTGLLLDPYFSGTKLAWLLDNVDGLRARAEAGEVVFGTVDSYLVARLTGRFVTDVTNASRTLLYNIDTGEWDAELLDLFRVPRAMLAEVKSNADDFGTTDPALFGAAIPVRGVAGDQQAAVIGNACFEPGMVKSTYGTGCFALINTGTERVASRNRLLTTIAYKLDGEVVYALEGAIFIAGAAVQWLRDRMRLIKHASEIGPLAERADPHSEVVLVPAFVGLGAPHWDANSRGAIFGLTRATGPEELAKAALDSVAYQTHDLLDAMHKDWHDTGNTVLRVDGGMVASDFTMQGLADILGAPVDRPKIAETTALGAAWLAGHAAGVWPDRAGFAAAWQRDRRFEPKMDEATRLSRIAAWQDAVSRTLSSR